MTAQLRLSTPFPIFVEAFIEADLRLRDRRPMRPFPSFLRGFHYLRYDTRLCQPLHLPSFPERLSLSGVELGEVAHNALFPLRIL